MFREEKRLRLVKHWNKLSTEVVKFPFLEIFKTWLTQLWLWSWPSLVQGVGVHDLPKTFPACESIYRPPCCWISTSEQPSPWSTDTGTSSIAQGAEQCLCELPCNVPSLLQEADMSIFSVWGQGVLCQAVITYFNPGGCDPASTVTVFWKYGRTVRNIMW